MAYDIGREIFLTYYKLKHFSMIYFDIPLRSKAAAKNWERFTEDFNKTLLRIVVPIALILSLLICQPVHNGINKLLNNLSK